MSFLDNEIHFDAGHLLLLVALVLFVLFVVYRCRLKAEGLRVAGDAVSPAALSIQKVHYQQCRCPSCVEAVYQKALSGDLYGCNASNPYIPYSKEECNYQYRKNALHGCGVA